MLIHLMDGTYELFRQYYGRLRFSRSDMPRYGAVAGVLHSVLEMIEGGATHVGEATDHVIESFRNDLWPESMDRVVKCTVLIDDMFGMACHNEVYATDFPTHKPARTAVGADGLALGVKLEIECWATVG